MIGKQPGRNSNTWIKCAALTVLLSGIQLLTTGHADAQGEKPVIRHTPIRSAQLPAPGMPMTISFDFVNFPESVARERLFVVRDGKLMDSSLLEGAAPGKEALAHNATVNAPLVELKYWAVVTLGNGEVVTSHPYTLRRTCIPDISLSSIQDPEGSLQERIAGYIQQSRDLERDLSQYEQAIKLLEDIVGKMKEDQ